MGGGWEGAPSGSVQSQPAAVAVATLHLHLSDGFNPLSEANCSSCQLDLL